MRRLILLFLAVLFPLPLVAAAVITAITPPSAPATGGTVVHVFGSGLQAPPLACPAITCGSGAYFDDLFAPAQAGSSDKELIVIAPPHAPGLVDLTINFGGKFANAFRYDDSAPGYLKVLVPVIARQVPGALGSLWQTEVSIYSQEDVDLVGYTPCLQVTSLPCSPSVHIRALTSVRDPFIAVPGGPAFIYVPLAAAPKVAFNVLLRDLSRVTTDFGMQLPAIRETDFRSHLTLTGVPTDPSYRLTLRIYSMTGKASQAHLTITDEATGATLKQETVLLNATDPGDNTGPIPKDYLPAFAQIALDYAYPTIMTGDRVRIDVSPATAMDQPIWAMVSITNNDTQHVTIMTPW